LPVIFAIHNSSPLVPCLSSRGSHFLTRGVQSKPAI
jgi:hypothetical protein